MRNKILILIPIVLLVLALVGCKFLTPPAPEPDPVPIPTMEAVALAELAGVEGEVDGEVDYWTIAWSIVNTGDVFIREYTLEFKVEYPDAIRDCVTIELTRTYLEVGDMHSDVITLAPYGNEDPKSVSVTWELSE